MEDGNKVVRPDVTFYSADDAHAKMDDRSPLTEFKHGLRLLTRGLGRIFLRR